MYAGAQAKYVLDGTRLAGRLRPAKDRAVRAWAAAHQSQLEECWERAANTEHPGFTPLAEDDDRFREVQIDLGTITWPNGADLAPEVLHATVMPNCTSREPTG